MAGYIYRCHVEGSIYGLRCAWREDGIFTGGNDRLLLEGASVQGTVQPVAYNVGRAAWCKCNYGFA
ncbi:hypothetical protein D3C81_1720240 [compost metagenome]